MQVGGRARQLALLVWLFKLGAVGAAWGCAGGVWTCTHDHLRVLLPGCISEVCSG